MRNILFAGLFALPLVACGSSGLESDELAQAKLEAAEAKLEAAEARLAASEAGEDDEDEAGEKSGSASADKAEKSEKSSSSASKKSETSLNLTSSDGFPAKNARCKFHGVAGADYDGSCLFIPHGGGSFTVERQGGGEFIDGYTQLIVELDTRTEAGLTGRRGGDLEFLNPVTRSNSDKACWEGEPYTICAY